MGIVRNQSIKNSISFYIGMAIGAINTVIIYPNVFNDHPEHFGLIQILVTYAIVIATFSSLGIPKTFIRFFPAIKQKGQLYFLSLITPLFGFVLISFCYVFFKDEILHLIQASNLLKENFYYIIILVFFISFYDVLTSISRSFLSAATPIFVNEVFLKLYSLIILLLYWFDYFNFTTFLQIYIAGYILKFCILFLIQVYKKRLSINLSLQDLKLKEMLSFGTYVLFSGASLMIVTRLDMIMISAMMDLKHVAFYTVAFFIGNAIKIPGKSILTIATPLLSRAWEENNIKQIQNIYSRSSINLLIVGGVFFLCIWLNIDDIFILLPEQFSHGKWVVLFISLSQLFNLATGVNGAIIVNSNLYKYDLITNIFLVVIALIANLIFIPKYGINGAAMATAFSVLLFNILRLILIKVKLDLQPFSIKTLYTLALLAVIYSLSNYIPVSGNVYFDLFWRSFYLLVLFVPAMLWLNLSEDINKIIVDVMKRFGS